MSVFSKVIEKAVTTLITDFVEAQDGFRCGRSTTTALFDLFNYIYTNLDNNNFMIGLFLVLSKTFNILNCKILLDKLCNYCFRGRIHFWIGSYLSNKKRDS